MLQSGGLLAQSGPIFAQLGAASARLGAALAQLRGTLAELGATLSQLGAILAAHDAASAQLGSFLPLVGDSPALLRALLGSLVPSWALLGFSWASKIGEDLLLHTYDFFKNIFQFFKLLS